MFGIIKKEFRERKLSLLIYCLVALMLTWVYVLLFPTVRDQAQSLNKLVETYPEALKKAFSIESSGFNTIESFLSYELFSLMWPLLAILLTISRAGNAIAGEIERNTIGTLLAQPLSRTRIFMSKYISGLASLTAFIVASILAPIPVAWMYHIPVHPKNFFLCAILCFVFGAAIYGVAMLSSAIASDRSKMYGVVGGALFLMYVLNVISGIKPELDKLKYASVFHYFNATSVMQHARLTMSSVGLFAAIALLSLAAGLWVFNKRDISI